MNSNKKQFVSNLIYAFVAQGLSFGLSVLMSLIVPRVLSLSSFGYWQLFIFYTSYVGIFHFGFNDGIYLINGGKEYNNLDHKTIGGAFWISFFVQLILGSIVLIVSKIIINVPDRQLVMICTIVYMLVFNSSFCLGYIFQAVNDTKKYSKSVMIDKASFMVILLFLLVCKVEEYRFFIWGYIVAKFISYVYCMIYAKDIVFIREFKLKKSIDCYWNSLKVGFNLTIAGIASMLILGIGRIVIDNKWGIEEFAKFSLVLSLASFAITFISQVSMVLFPTLRRVEAKEQRNVYISFRALLSVVLPAIFMFCIPLKVLVQIWLPKYESSLEYLAMAMPICFFDAKMNLLCNTFFKVLREEKFLRKVNVISLFFSTCTCCSVGIIFNNSFLVLVCMVASVALRSVLSELYLAKKMNNDIKKVLVSEILYVLNFLIVYYNVPNLITLFVVSVLYVVFLVINRKNVTITKDFILGVIK